MGLGALDPFVDNSEGDTHSSGQEHSPRWRRVTFRLSGGEDD
jgi:hypothetical protein